MNFQTIRGVLLREAERFKVDLDDGSEPDGEVLRLGKDLRLEFPAALAKLENARLLELLQQLEASDSVHGSGASDWADLGERMRFIATLFRGYHEKQSLFVAPFSEEQLASLRAGRRPAGPL